MNAHSWPDEVKKTAAKQENGHSPKDANKNTFLDKPGVTDMFNKKRQHEGGSQPNFENVDNEINEKSMSILK